MPKLYILCGPSASGKTTWAMNFIKQSPDEIYYVSRDEIRFSMLKEDEDYFAHEGTVFKQFASAIVNALTNNHDVIADATHLNHFSRAKLINTIDKTITNYSIIYVVFYTPYNECLQHNRSREGRAFVAVDAIANMFRTFQAPVSSEDDRAIKIISINADKKQDNAYMNDPYWLRSIQ